MQLASLAVHLSSTSVSTGWIGCPRQDGESGRSWFLRYGMRVTGRETTRSGLGT